VKFYPKNSAITGERKQKANRIPSNGGTDLAKAQFSNIKNLRTNASEFLISRTEKK